MNYNRIKLELEKRGITIKEFCRKVDITEQGLHQMIRNNSMRIDVLERISEILDVPVSYWFDEVPLPQGSEQKKPNPILSRDQRIDKVTTELNILLKSFLKDKHSKK